MILKSNFASLPWLAPYGGRPSQNFLFYTQYVTMNGYYQSFILGEAGDDLSAISLVDPFAHPSSERNDVQRKE